MLLVFYREVTSFVYLDIFFLMYIDLMIEILGVFAKLKKLISLKIEEILHYIFQLCSI